MTTHPFSFLSAVARLFRHRWHDQRVRHSLTDAALQRLTKQVATSEERHSGQIRICVEGGLPWGYLRSHAPCRERALAMFSKLHVWDTEHNNGVLIYLLLADRSIEIVADRGLRAYILNSEWQQMVTRMASAFRSGQFEQGLALAVEEVTTLLSAYFPVHADGERANELPDEPYIAEGKR
ncbi:MAG: TPM domain-containing protein [Giesbergeria sp.]